MWGIHDPLPYGRAWPYYTNPYWFPYGPSVYLPQVEEVEYHEDGTVKRIKYRDPERS